MRYAILIISWAGYFFFHSWLASTLVKDFFAKKLKSKLHYYRLSYNILSTVGLFGLLILNGSISSPAFFEGVVFARYISLMLATFGVFVIKAAFREYKLSSFLGLKEEQNGFSTSGILNKVRHPIYSGTILIAVGFFLFNPNLPTLVSMLCIFCYLIIGIQLEENKLIQQFGDTYLAYKKRVPMLIPHLFKK